MIQPGEQVLWVGRPRGAPVALPATRYLVLIALGVGYVLEEGVGYLLDGVGPLPIVFRVMLFAVGSLFLLPLYWARRRDRDTTYAVTTHRLLMSIGSDRDQVREVRLTALGRVKRDDHVRYYRNQGGILWFRKARQASKTPVWSFVESGKPDPWDSPWCVDEPEAVLDIIETARSGGL